VLKTSARLDDFGKKQNNANELLAANINELIKRVCLLEDQQVHNNDIMKRIASELSAFKTEIDRLKLTSKLNTNAIDRLNSAIALSSGEEDSKNA
jgi:peptidoglycan hydrolase CwlO-like protein